MTKYKSYHNHEVDVHLVNSELWQEVPQTVRAGKFCVVPTEWKILGEVLNYSNTQVSQAKSVLSVPDTSARFYFAQETPFSIFSFSKQDGGTEDDATSDEPEAFEEFER